MKNQLLQYTLLISLLSFNCWAQKNQNALNVNKLQEVSTTSPTINKVENSSTRNIKYYHVEEIVLSKFGGHKTIYNVSTPLAIRTYDLGLNGKRIITPVYNDQKQFVQNEQLNKAENLLINNDVKPTTSDVTEKKDSHVYIDIIKTYERVANKGFESIEMLKKMGNSYFFENEYEKAEKCYTKLFNISSDLEPFYYYRYSIVLKSVGNINKSEEFLNKFNQLSSTVSRQ